MLVGNVGGGFWDDFQTWSGCNPDRANPLDSWSRDVIEPVAALGRAHAVYPFELPHHPFQQWAMRAERLKSSPIGIVMHPQFGLWHAYRGALLFDRSVSPPLIEPPTHPCDACRDKPCMSACPVRAHSASGFDYPGCLAWARSPASTCRDGCLDRNACPVGVDHRYPAALQGFLMRAFLRD